jgi:DNA-binding MarR family transcriptional regulator
MKRYVKVQEGRLIGALLRVPFLAVIDRIYQGMIEAGFDDLSHAHLAVFRHIDEDKGSRLVDLADEAQITKQSMGYLVDYLVEHGYVERAPDESDGRARLIRLTKRGAAVMMIARTVARDLEAEWTDHLGSERMACMLDALRDLTTMLEDERVNGKTKRGS